MLQNHYKNILRHINKNITQSIYINGIFYESETKVEDSLQFIDLSNCKNFLDLGCNLGNFCTAAYNNGAKNILGIDYDENLIDLAKNFSKGDFKVCDFLNLPKLKLIVNDFFNKEPIDILILFSIFYELQGTLLNLLKTLDWKICYIESNDLSKTELIKQFHEDLEKSGYKKELICTYNNVNNREIWKLINKGN